MARTKKAEPVEAPKQQTEIEKIQARTSETYEQILDKIRKANGQD